MDDDELRQFYTAGYRQLYQGQEDPTPADLAVQRGRAEHLAELLCSHLGTCATHLDIGCSSGTLLEAVAQRLNVGLSVGIELSDAYRAYCTDRGLMVYRSLEELQTACSQQFELVTMSHVLEHLTDPASYLRKLHNEVLTADGSLLVEVPNLYGHNCFEVAHNFSFSPQTLSEALRSTGFALQVLRKHAVPTSKPDRPVYLTVIAKSCSDIMPAHRVRRSNPLLVYYRRQIGLSGGSLLTFLFSRGRRVASRVTAPIRRV